MFPVSRPHRLQVPVRTHLAPEVQPIYSGYYIWRGAPHEADLSPKTSFLITPFSWPISCRPSATRFRVRTTNCVRVTGATISAGIAWQTPGR
jgi:hypothetical protein